MKKFKQGKSLTSMKIDFVAFLVKVFRLSNLMK